MSDIYMQCGSHIYSGAYGNMLNCSLESVYVIIVVTSDFIFGIYVVIVPLCINWINN